MKLPTKHLSVRVPWHDRKWDGCICDNPLDNSFCRVLSRIDAEKNADAECEHCSSSYSALDFTPPCVDENGGFLSSSEFKRTLIHNYKKIGNSLFNDFQPVIFTHKPFSVNAIPFKWMLKSKYDHVSEMSQRYSLEYDPDKEESLCDSLGFRPNWVQNRDNQRELLDTFFSALEPNKSIVFFYAKHTPLSETNQKVLIGAAYVKYVGDIVDYKYPKNYSGHRAYVWDRLVCHSLIDDDGCILPYHELHSHILENPNDTYDVKDCISFVPDHDQFSHGAELVESDLAIDALFSMQSSFKKAEKILGISLAKQIEWIENSISHVWDMRGAFPSMGCILSALEFENGNAVAWAIEKHIIEQYGSIFGADPWVIFNDLINGRIVLNDIAINKTMQTQWKAGLTDLEKKKIRLLSRVQMNNEQAVKALTIDTNVVLDNPFILYERFRRDYTNIPFTAVDKAMYPISKINDSFPVDEVISPLDNALDIRRIRAAVISVIEARAEYGHTLVEQGNLLDIIAESTYSVPMPLNKAIIENYSKEDFFQQDILKKENDQGMVFYKLKLLENVRVIIERKINIDVLEKRQLKCKANYQEHLDNTIGSPCAPDDIIDKTSRSEKLDAMDIMSRYRFSVIVGPAGSGKTTLLRAFCENPEIRDAGYILLAPTGKARVNMGPSAQTVAQFLYQLKRYDIYSGKYFVNIDAPREQRGTLIIDEASMLTEEQLAAVFDAVQATRIILVGDYRQLPPIGAGRPFFDIVQKLKPSNGCKTGTAYAELTNISRQKATEKIERHDVKLSKIFGSPEKYDFEEIPQLLTDIANNPSSGIQLIRWDDQNDLRTKIISSIVESLKLDEDNLKNSFEYKALGKNEDNYFNYNNAEKQIEKWQIVSPNNGHFYGVKEINKLIQGVFRDKTFKWVLENKYRIPQPQGRDNFIYGDKVISLGNRKMKNNLVIPSSAPSPLYYMANGEIGSVVGQFKRPYKGGKPPYVWIAFSSQSGYAYSFKQGQFDEGKNGFDFELAYCISVHKSQGSGFDTTFFILPSSTPLLSRELLYTALTRQKEKIVILHEGDFSNYLKFASDEYSETARRLSDLFELPSIQKVENKKYDSRYVNISRRGEPVISKSEAIIANILFGYEEKGDLTYSYESKYTASNGRRLTPDFVIEHSDTGRVFYWEHLGLLNSEDYRQKWEAKRQAYLADGLVPAKEATIEDDKVLITSQDLPQGGIDSKAIDQLIKDVILNY